MPEVFTVPGLSRTHTHEDIAELFFEEYTRHYKGIAPEQVSHAQRVAKITDHLASSLGLTQAPERTRAALLHDLGKMGVPDAIITKRDRLTPAERRIMQRHTRYTFMALRTLLPQEALIAVTHHEYQPNPYSRDPRTPAPQNFPDRRTFHPEHGLTTNRSILAAADTLDAMARPRPYARRRDPVLRAALCDGTLGSLLYIRITQNTALPPSLRQPSVLLEAIQYVLQLSRESGQLQ